MKKLLFCLFGITCLINNIIFADTKKETMTLHNGAPASVRRIEKVWNSLNVLYKKNMLEYYWLWRTAKLARALNNDQCLLSTLFQEADRHYLKPLASETITFIESNQITRLGVLDKETQDIIISSYRGTAEPKIVDIRYPASILEKMAYSLKTFWD